VYIFGDALEPELATLGCFLKAGSVFVDIGANIGMYTVKAAREVGESGTVIACGANHPSGEFLYG
jgi:precorrin-6B methylase 2